MEILKATVKPGTYKNWWEYIPGGEKLKEYCDVTTLHGFKYLGESGRSLSERLVCFSEIWYRGLHEAGTAGTLALWNCSTFKYK